MKKLLTLALSLVIALTLTFILAACDSNEAPADIETQPPQVEEPVPEPEPEPMPPEIIEPDPTPEETGGAVLGIEFPNTVEGSYVFGWENHDMPIGDRIPDILRGLPESMEWVFETESYYIEQCWVRSPDYAIVIRLNLPMGSIDDYDDLIAYYGEEAISISDLTDAEGKEFLYDWGFIKLQNPGGFFVEAEITGDYGASWELPINGRPLDVPPPFETHPADSTYYYQKEDDFALWILDMNYTAYTEDYGDNIQYNLLFNGKNENGYDYGIQHKWVFESEEMAMKFMTDQGLGGSYVIAGNVVYSTITVGHGNFEETLAVGQNNIDQNGGEMYRSMP